MVLLTNSKWIIVFGHLENYVNIFGLNLFCFLFNPCHY